MHSLQEMMELAEGLAFDESSINEEYSGNSVSVDGRTADIKFGKKTKGNSFSPYVTNGVMSSYQIKPSEGMEKVDYVTLLNHIKSGEDPETTEKLITKASVHLLSIIKDKSVDIILPMPSSKPLTKNVSELISHRLHGYHSIRFDMSKLESVEFDDDGIARATNVSASGSKAVVNSVNKSLKETGKISMTNIKAQFRSLLPYIIKNMFTMENDNGIEGKHVLIIDDILTSGTSLLFAEKLMYSLGASKVTKYTVFKNAK